MAVAGGGCVTTLGGQPVAAGGAGRVAMLGAGSVALAAVEMRAMHKATYVDFMTVTDLSSRHIYINAGCVSAVYRALVHGMGHGSVGYFV